MTLTLKRLYWLVFLSLFALALFRFFYVPPLSSVDVVMETRGLAAPVNKDFEAMVERLRQEDERSMLSYVATLALMQIRVDGTIPLWGVIVLASSLIGTAIGAVVALVRRIDLLAAELTRHNEVDEIRFATISDRIAIQHNELREDLGKIAAGTNNGRRG